MSRRNEPPPCLLDRSRRRNSSPERVHVSGRDATLVVWSPDYDGKGKEWVRFDDGTEPSSAAHASSGSRCSSASTRAKPPFAPSSTPYFIVVSRSSGEAKRMVCVSFVRSPRSSNSSVCRWFWNVCTSRSGASTSRNSPSTTPKPVRKRYVPPGRTSISSTTVPSPHHSGISFGSVQTEKTCARGASKIRSTRISSSFGVVTVVVSISADRSLHELADLCLVGCGQLRQREGDRPHGAVVEFRSVVEAEHRVPLLELPRVAEEAHDLAV